jgi:hypothetical protein
MMLERLKVKRCVDKGGSDIRRRHALQAVASIQDIPLSYFGRHTVRTRAFGSIGQFNTNFTMKGETNKRD